MSQHEDNPKSRGRKHVKNKSKYKPRGIGATSTSGRSKKIDLGSNWDRYEAEEENPNQLTDSTNYALLASAPISQGSYFQFKKRDNLSGDEFKASEFSLDLNVINAGLSTVPFYKRCRIPKKVFTETQIKEMDEEASDKSKKIIPLYKTPSLEMLRLDEDNRLEKSPGTGDCLSNSGEKISRHTSDVDDLLEIAESGEGAGKSKLLKEAEKSCDQPEEDLEEWLDDILNT